MEENGVVMAQEQEPMQQPIQPMQPLPSPGGVLTFGILSLVFCETFVLGLIFGIIACAKAGKFNRAGVRSGQVRAGKIMGIIGIVFSCIFLILWICLAVAGIFAINS